MWRCRTECEGEKRARGPDWGGNARREKSQNNTAPALQPSSKKSVSTLSGGSGTSEQDHPCPRNPQEEAENRWEQGDGEAASFKQTHVFLGAEEVVQAGLLDI